MSAAPPNGLQLKREIDDYCARVGMSLLDFSRHVDINETTLRGLPGRSSPHARTYGPVREFIAANPHGDGVRPNFAPARPSITLEQAQASDRAPKRQRSPEYRARLREASAAEKVATICVETPAELIATVQRQWPALWERVVGEARAAGTMPGAMLARVIERGLEAGA